MAKFARFLRLYWTELTTATAKLIVDPVRVEFFEGPRTYDIFDRIVPPVVPAGVEQAIAVPQKMTVEAGRRYVELIARTDQAFGRRQYCEDQIDRVVTQLSALLSSGLFAQQVWSGWMGNPEAVNADFWLQLALPVNVDAKELEKELGAFQTSVARDRNIEDRFTLMSKLFARALAIPPGEERFLWLWTVLEVFPMQDTSNIRPLMDYLSRVTGRTLPDVTSKLDIGHSLYGARCKLVHDGKLPYCREELGKVLGKLEAIVLTVLRDVGGLSYRGHLDKYFS